jgi:hypothetical protein
VYTIRAQHPSTRFASFVATCKPGRVINANPPWGLHQLGKRNKTKVAFRGDSLRVTNLPPGAIVRLKSCAEATCSVRRRSDGRRRIDLPLGGVAPGQTLEVLVTAHAYDGKLVRLRLREGRGPAAKTLCVPLGNTKPRRSCR